MKSKHVVIPSRINIAIILCTIPRSVYVYTILIFKITEFVNTSQVNVDHVKVDQNELQYKCEI